MFPRPGSAGSSQLQTSVNDLKPEITALPPDSAPQVGLRQNVGTAHPLSSDPRPRPLTTPSKPLRSLHTSAPASPPTPAPSPRPHQLAPSWRQQQQQSCEDDEVAFVQEATSSFVLLGKEARQRFLAQILNLCDSRQLGFVQQYVSPMLKRDPFKVLPNELCLRVCRPVFIV